jgi:hypothetical protein
MKERKKEMSEGRKGTPTEVKGGHHRSTAYCRSLNDYGGVVAADMEGERVEFRNQARRPGGRRPIRMRSGCMHAVWPVTHLLHSDESPADW